MRVLGAQVKTAKFVILGLLVVAVAIGALAVSGIRITLGISSPNETLFAKQSLQLLSLFGHYSAPHILASMKIFQSENDEDRREGFLFLKQEAENGSCYSAGKIGWAYQKGFGVDANLQKAISLYEQAAKCGMTHWQILLSHAHKEGYLGFTASEEQAEYWKTMEPKTHIATYECWVATYYRDGVFPENSKKASQYEQLCAVSQQEPE